MCRPSRKLPHASHRLPNVYRRAAFSLNVHFAVQAYTQNTRTTDVLRVVGAIHVAISDSLNLKPDIFIP